MRKHYGISLGPIHEHTQRLGTAWNDYQQALVEKKPTVRKAADRLADIVEEEIDWLTENLESFRLPPV